MDSTVVQAAGGGVLFPGGMRNTIGEGADCRLAKAAVKLSEKGVVTGGLMKVKGLVMGTGGESF